MGYINIKITPRQLQAIKNQSKTISFMVDSGELDKEEYKDVEYIEKMFKTNKI